MNAKRINQLQADNNYRLKLRNHANATPVFFMTQHNDEEKLAQFRRETALRRKKQQEKINKLETQEKNRAQKVLNERKRFIKKNAINVSRRPGNVKDIQFEESKDYFREAKQRLKRKEDDLGFSADNSDEEEETESQWTKSARVMDSLDLQSSVHDSTSLFMIAENLANRDSVKASRVVSMLIAQGIHKHKRPRKASSAQNGNRSNVSTPSPPSSASSTSPCSTPSPPSSPIAEEDMYKAGSSRLQSRSGLKEFKTDVQANYDFKLVLPAQQNATTKTIPRRLLRGNTMNTLLTNPVEPAVPKQKPGAYRRPWRENYLVGDKGETVERGIPKRRQYKIIQTGFSTEISSVEKSVARLDKMLKETRSASVVSTMSNAPYNPYSDFNARQQRADEVLENPSSVHQQIHNFEHQMQHMKLKEELEQQPQALFPNGVDPSTKKKLRVPIFRSKPIAITENAHFNATATPREPIQQITVQHYIPMQEITNPIEQQLSSRTTSRESRIPRLKQTKNVIY
jgi:hypothetical protein